MSLLRSLASLIVGATAPARPRTRPTSDGCPVCRRVEEERRASLA